MPNSGLVRAPAPREPTSDCVIHSGIFSQIYSTTSVHRKGSYAGTIQRKRKGTSHGKCELLTICSSSTRIVLAPLVRIPQRPILFFKNKTKHKPRLLDFCRDSITINSVQVTTFSSISSTQP